MVIGLKLYEKPNLTTEVKIGQVLEALSPSHAARYHTIKGEWVDVKDNPTNIFGYVRGQLNSTVKIPIVEEYDIFSTYKLGTTLVERILPITFPEVKDDERNDYVESWGPIGKQVYLVIGELVDADGACYDDGIFSHHLSNGSISLSPEQLDKLREELLGFIRQRGKKEYVFESHGHVHTLKEIILSLRANK